VAEFERNLQRRFLYVSWAQRTSSYSTGPVTDKNSTLAQHYEDLKAVLQVLRKRYPGKRLIALGYSFGGIVTLGHLGSADAEPVDGVVLMAAPMGGELVESVAFAVLDAFAAQQIEQGSDVHTWQSFRALNESQPEAYATLPRKRYWDQYTLVQHARCSDMEKSLGIDEVPAPVERAGQINPSEVLVVPGKWTYERAVDWLYAELLDFDLSQSASRIRAPTLLLWGAQDCRVGLSAGQSLFDALGASDKQLAIEPEHGHFLLYQNPDFVSDQIEKFIDGL
jgi:pimeloyl-ACP methyl ester carboxylesterase